MGALRLKGAQSLDVNRLHREGCLRPGWVGGWQWTRDGEKVASISVRAEEECLLLLYRYRSGGGDDWQEIEELVSIDWTPCHFGGARPWFVCPGVVHGVACRRRVGKLYGPGRYLLCRHCYRLAYQSQREQPYERSLRRANNIRIRLGGDPGVLSPFPEKPKGMHWRTFKRLSHQVHRAERWAEGQFAMRLDRLEPRVGRRNRARGFGHEQRQGRGDARAG